MRTSSLLVVMASILVSQADMCVSNSKVLGNSWLNVMKRYVAFFFLPLVQLEVISFEMDLGCLKLVYLFIKIITEISFRKMNILEKKMFIYRNSTTRINGNMYLMSFLLY